MWYPWSIEDKPLKGMQIPCSNRYRELFEDFTTIKLGDESLKNKASSLYTIAKRKNRIVQKELTYADWIRLVGRISMTQGCCDK